MYRDNFSLTEPEIRNIKLYDGSTLTLEATQAFYDYVRIKLELSVLEEITDDHIRRFIYYSVNNALDKAEKNEQ